MRARRQTAGLEERGKLVAYAPAGADHDRGQQRTEIVPCLLCARERVVEGVLIVPPEQRFRRQLAVCEGEDCELACAQSYHLLDATNNESWCVAGHEERADAVASLSTVHCGEGDDAIGACTIGDEAFGAVQTPSLRGFGRRHPHGGRVRSAVGLRDGE